MAQSDTILGRARSSFVFCVLRQPLTVSAYRATRGQLRYSDPVRTPHSGRSNDVLYRVRVTPRLHRDPDRVHSSSTRPPGDPTP